MSGVHSFSCLVDLSYVYPSVHLSVIPIHISMYRLFIYYYQSIYFIISHLPLYPDLNHLSIFIMY